MEHRKGGKPVKEILSLCDTFHARFSSCHFKVRNHTSKWFEIVKRGDKHFILVTKKVNGIIYIFVCVTGHVTLADNYKVVLSLGKNRQTTISHHGKVFSIDQIVNAKKEESVLKLSMGGIGQMLLRQTRVPDFLELRIKCTIEEKSSKL